MAQAVEYSTLKNIKTLLDAKFTEGWNLLETETILLELGLIHNELFAEKVNVLKVIEHRPNLFFTEIMFFLHSTEVINNNVTDFDTVPMPTSLEMAASIVEVCKLLGIHWNEAPNFTGGIPELIKFILVNEGYTTVPHPFDIVGIHDFPKPEGYDPKADALAFAEASAKKEKAISEYVKSVSSQSGS